MNLCNSVTATEGRPLTLTVKYFRFSVSIVSVPNTNDQPSLIFEKSNFEYFLHLIAKGNESYLFTEGEFRMSVCTNFHSFGQGSEF